ncbi:MAG: alpha-ribazole phosphatase [Clostridium sp.]
MNIYLVRHGQTRENKEGTFYGSIDNGLTEEGKCQCSRLKSFLTEKNIDKVYISKKLRTMESAEFILDGKIDKGKFILDERLNERDFGLFEGLHYDSIKKSYPKECTLWERDWINFQPPQGESYSQMYNRVKDVFEEIINGSSENVLIVTHSGVIRSIYSYISGDNMELFWKFACKNGDIAVVKYEYENLYIEAIIPNSIL